jgi:hypothetical protein
MKMIRLLPVVVVGLAVALITQPVVALAQAEGGSVSERLVKVFTPPATALASNSTTAQIDFRAAPVVDYQITDLSGNLSLQLTNLRVGHTARVHIDTDGSARTISILTNGITTGVEVLYPYVAVNTNGNSAFTVTNRSRVDLTVDPRGKIVEANFWHYR